MGAAVKSVCSSPAATNNRRERERDAQSQRDCLWPSSGVGSLKSQLFNF